MVLVHGLMGRGSTWSRQLPWLTQLGAVYTYDAPWHRGRDVADPYPISTERFVADLGDAVAALDTPARLVGHSMGALHSWCLAAERPDLVLALVVEDMAPDFRGRTTGPWEPWLHNLPVEFDSAEKVFAEFGPARRPVLPGSLRPDCNRLAAARPHVPVDRDRSRMGHPRLLGAMARGALTRAAGRGRQLGHSCGPDARDERNRLPDRRICMCPARATWFTTRRRRYIARRWSRFWLRPNPLRRPRRIARRSSVSPGHRPAVSSALGRAARYRSAKRRRAGRG